MDEFSKTIVNEVEVGVKNLKTKIDQYKQVMNCNYELKQKMKEEFYKQKIQEAKDKKVKPIVYNNKIFRYVFKWDELPAEVEKQILDYKEKIEKDWYIDFVIKHYNLTYKSFNGFIFKYRSENDEGFKWVPNISCDFPTWLWAMVNKKNIIQELKKSKPSSSFSKKSNAVQKEYDRITKYKTPSLEDYIEYRKEEKKKQSEDRKKKNTDKPVVYNSNYKIGDIICSNKKVVDDNGDLLEMTNIDGDDCYVYIHPYVIIGETKSQYRVERLRWSRLEINDDYDGDNYCYTIDKEYTHRRYGIKSKNIGKKSVIELEQTDDTLYYDYFKKY